MSLRFVLAAAAWLAAVSAGAQTLPPAEADALAALNASPRHAEWVTVPAAGGDSFSAWVVYPERADRAPVVVLIHEIFGLTDWARAVADAYAAEGFLVIAPDFLSGKAPDGKGGSAALGPDASRGAIAKLDNAELTSRLNAAARWATSQPSATSAYGVVGYCWGGGISYSWATTQPGLKAAVGFYGTAPTPEAIDRIQAPVLALYGGSDARVTSTLAPFRDEMAKQGKSFTSEVYEGAGHAFLRQQGGMNGANLLAAQKSWPKSVAFLKAALEGKKTAETATFGAEPAAFDDCCEPELTVASSVALLP
jgi:carboxymethylenebutenolidase